MMKNHFSEVIILGAGASANFTPISYPFDQTLVPFPLANDFFQKAIKYSNVLKECNWRGEPLHKDLLDFIKHNFNYSLEDLRKVELSVEDVYIRLDEFITEYDKSKHLNEEKRNLYFARKDLLQLIEELFSRLSRHYGPCKYHAALAKHAVGCASAVVSFNWDTLMDEGLYNTKKWFYETGYGFEFQRLYLDRMQILKKEEASKALLLKPHGSINWFRYQDIPWSGRNGFTGEPFLNNDWQGMFLFEFSKTEPLHMNPKDMRLKLGKDYKPPLKKPCEIDIIPPTVLGRISKWGERPSFKIIWEKVVAAIEEAEKIIVIGYALKESYIQERFKEARRRSNKSLLLTLVDKSVGASEFLELYKDVFNPYKIIQYQHLSEFIKCIEKHPFQ